MCVGLLSFNPNGAFTCFPGNIAFTASHLVCPGALSCLCVDEGSVLAIKQRVEPTDCMSMDGPAIRVSLTEPCRESESTLGNRP